MKRLVEKQAIATGPSRRRMRGTVAAAGPSERDARIEAARARAAAGGMSADHMTDDQVLEWEVQVRGGGLESGRGCLVE